MSKLEEDVAKILEHQLKQTTDIALIKQSQDLLLNDYKETKSSHYKLRDEFRGLKGKVVLVAGVIGSIVTLVANWVYKVFSGNG
jgi:hypothetical protein